MLAAVLAGRQTARVFGERQINLHRNPNVRYEFFMRGALSTLPNVKYYDVPAKTKHVIARERLNWTYVKCASRKSFRKAMGDSAELAASARDWKCFHYSFKDYKLTAYSNIDAQKKFDDFVDTLLLLETPHFLKARRAKHVHSRCTGGGNQAATKTAGR